MIASHLTFTWGVLVALVLGLGAGAVAGWFITGWRGMRDGHTPDEAAALASRAVLVALAITLGLIALAIFITEVLR